MKTLINNKLTKPTSRGALKPSGQIGSHHKEFKFRPVPHDFLV